MWDRPDHIAASPADRAREALADDPSRTDREIALAVRSTPAIVASARRELTAAGVLPAAPFPQRHPPRFKDLPCQPPELARGTCAGHPDADCWTSSDPERREFARNVCRFACPVTVACFEWSLSLPESDTAIWGGTTASDRIRIRAQRAGRPIPFSRTTAGKNSARVRRRAAAQQAHHQDTA